MMPGDDKNGEGYLIDRSASLDFGLISKSDVKCYGFPMTAIRSENHTARLYPPLKAFWQDLSLAAQFVIAGSIVLFVGMAITRIMGYTKDREWCNPQ